MLRRKGRRRARQFLQNKRVARRRGSTPKGGQSEPWGSDAEPLRLLCRDLEAPKSQLGGLRWSSPKAPVPPPGGFDFAPHGLRGAASLATAPQPGGSEKPASRLRAASQGAAANQLPGSGGEPAGLRHRGLQAATSGLGASVRHLLPFGSSIMHSLDGTTGRHFHQGRRRNGSGLTSRRVSGLERWPCHPRRRGCL